MHLSVEWVSRDYNMEADQLSRFNDPNDYMLDPACFRYIDQLWGPHTVDHFASLQTRQLERFCSRYHNPRCEAVDAFLISWLKENTWIFPPPYLIPCVLKHMSAGGEIGTLLLPRWPLSCVVATPCQHRWILESLHYALNYIPTLPRDFLGRICGEQCIYIGHSIISDSSPSYLLSLMAQTRIICSSNPLAVIHVSL